MIVLKLVSAVYIILGLTAVIPPKNPAENCLTAELILIEVLEVSDAPSLSVTINLRILFPIKKL